MRNYISKFILIIIVSAICNTKGYSCDVCGSSVSANGTGLLSNYRYNLVGLSYQNILFSNTSNYSMNVNDEFQTLALQVRFHISDRWKIALNQPYRQNSRVEEDSEDVKISGLSNMRFSGHFAIFDKKKIKKINTLHWELGAGVQLPFGNYDPALYAKNIPDNFNVSTGSFGYFFQSNMVFSHKQVGINANLYYLHNQPNSETGYQFGAQQQGSFVFFVDHTINKNLKIIPFGGVLLEKTAFNKYYGEIPVEGTNGTGNFINVGTNIQYKKSMISMSYARPFNQNYGDNIMKMKQRISVEVSFLF